MPAKVEATPALPGLSPVCGKPIIARFDGGQLSSDAGVLALREIESRLGNADRLAACVADPRAAGRVVHGVADILRKRSFETLGACAADQAVCAGAQCQGMSSSIRLLGQPLTRRVSRSVM